MSTPTVSTSVPKVSAFRTLISAPWVGSALMGPSHGDHSSGITAQLTLLHRFPSWAVSLRAVELLAVPFPKVNYMGRCLVRGATPVLGAAGEELRRREISSPSISCASNPTLPLKCLFLDYDSHGLSVCIIIWMDGGGEDISDHGIQLACFKYRRSTFILNVQLRCLRVFLLNTFKL